ncbi:hypothetical protein [Enterococcus hirae]|uniref:hypothetical protein n=1 Tax=Enterococcus hirae TaxID=1354 RepID=UPI00211B5D4E|nr:hypothetical protein [Enterococcus hirae]
MKTSGGSDDNKKEFFETASHVLKNSGLFQGADVSGFFIKLNYELILYGGRWSWDTIGYIVILHLSGLSGLILSAQLDKGKAKWILLGINYLFATYYHIYIFLH